MLNNDFTHSDVLSLWQGPCYLSRAARDIGVPKPRYRRWIAQDNVPPRYWPQLIAAVKTHFGIRLTTDQLTDAAVRAATAKDAQANAIEAA